MPESLSLERRYVYDAHQRLCKTLEPDAGITVWDYDAAGNVAWRATAQNALTAATDCQHGAVASAQRSVHHYDALNRLLFVDHPSGTDDVGYTYEADGALASATVGVLTTAGSRAPIAVTTTTSAASRSSRMWSPRCSRGFLACPGCSVPGEAEASPLAQQPILELDGDSLSTSDLTETHHPQVLENPSCRID